MRSVDNIRQRLLAVRRSELLNDLLRGGLTTVAISAVTLLAFVLLEASLHASIQLRTALWYTWIGTSAIALAYYCGAPLLSLFGARPQQTIDDIAIRVGRAYDDVGDRLVNALQLDAQPAFATSGLAAAAVDQATRVAEPKDFTVIIDRKPTRSAALWALMSVGMTVALIALLPHQLGASFERLRNYNRSYLPPAPFALSITPLDETVMRGTTTRVVVSATGTPPNVVTLWVKEASSDRFQAFALRRDTGSTYLYQFSGLQAGVAFYAEAAWLEEGVRTDTGRITVIDKPLVRTLTGRVIPPSYTMQPPSELTEQHADVASLVGSTVDISITANKELKNATIVVVRGDSVNGDTSRYAMQTRGAGASGRFSVAASGTYHLELRDKDGQGNAEPVRYRIVALSDGSPTIALQEPTQDAEVDQSAELRIGVTITDDYGFSSLKLFYRLAASRFSQPDVKFTALDITLTGEGTVRDVRHLWDLGKVGITPEDVYEFYIEVADNDRVRGPKTARTSTLKVRMPSLEEVFAEADQTQSDAQKELKEVAKEAEEIRKEAEQLQREMQKQQSQQQQNMQWSDAKKAQDIMKRQEQLEQRMEDVAKKLEDMTDKMKQNNAISPETLEKYMELQKLMKEVKSPELERLQKQMQDAMEKMSPDDMQKAMKDFKFNEEEFRKQIERTMALLKRTQAEQKTEELAKRAEELARRQEELKQRTENSNANDKKQQKDLSQQQEQIKKDFEDLAKEANELEKMMKELQTNMPLDKMEQAQQDLNQSETSQQMDQAQSDIEQGKQQSAASKQQKAKENLERFAQQMQQMKKEMRRNSAKEAMRAMQRSINDMLELSKEQEALRDQTQSLDPNSSQFPSMAQKQQKMNEAMQNVANSMMQLGQRSASVTPEMAQDMGDALQNMQQATQQLQNRNGQMASKDQGGAVSSMNSAVQRMSDALSSMMQGEGQGQGGQGQNPGMGEGKGQSPFQRLQNLAEDQKSINEGMQKMGQQGSPSEQQRAEMGRLASQQGKALKALEEIEKEKRQVGGEKQPLGDLKNIANEMREVMTDMQSNSITPETRARQDRILSRLLDASRSMNDRDYEKSRESRSGQDAVRRSPGPLDLKTQEGRTQVMRDLLNRLRDGYSKDYENLIRLYFETLQKQRVEQ
ncbi:MAG: DUF4175 family protein [bacterium]|nr:DUF4175 family protein [bacterium]